MSDPTGTPAVPATSMPVMPPPVVPVVPTAPIAPPAPITAAQVPAAVTATDPDNPTWLPGRLAQAKEQAQKALLKDLGVTDPEEAKRILAEHAKEQEKNKTLAQKHAEAESRAAKLAAELTPLQESVKAIAATELAALPPDWQVAVKAAAGDDPAAQLRQIAAFKPLIARPSPAAMPATPAPQVAVAAVVPAAPAVPATPPPPAPVAPPLNTAPPPFSPPAAGANQTTNHLAVYEQFVAEKKHIAAANYFDKHTDAIVAAQKQRAG